MHNLPKQRETRRVTQKRLLKSRFTLGVSTHDEVDRVKKVIKPQKLKVVMNKNGFDHNIDKMLSLKNDFE